MTEQPAPSPAQRREAETFAGLMDIARSRQQSATSAAAPRFILEGAQAMASHLALSEADLQASLAPMTFWQQHMPGAIGAHTWDFAAVRERLPHAYAQVRTALEPLESRPQVVSTVFHMAAFPLLCTLIGAAWRDLHDGPLHALMAARNIGWLRLGGNRWVLDAVEVISTDPAGLRQLAKGLKDGSIKRLLILPDGPHRPGTPGVRALEGVSAGLGVKTTLISKLHGLGIPIAPFIHEWDDGALRVTPCPVLDRATHDEAETIRIMTGHIEDLLQRRPEQWLNWNAARLRT
ncbi:hypothetical protein [Caulobacter segnis]